jgi:hypothetical protein
MEILKSRTHVCLVYNTATANITPALDPEFRPEEVILVHGPQQKYRADCLESVLKAAGIKVTCWLLTHIFDSEHVRSRILELLSSRDNDDMALNASGGTRPMIVGAYEVFRELGMPAFYVHPETDHVSWIHRRDLPSFNCADRIRLPAFLKAHGATKVKTASAAGIPQNLRQVTNDLIIAIEQVSPALTALNWLAQQADNADLISPELDDRLLVWRELKILLDRFAAEGLLSVHERRVQFRDEPARFYVNGGWLEQHVFGLLFGMRKHIPEIQDIARGVEFARQAGGNPVKNELDIALLANNRCYIIECKTKRFSMRNSDRFEPDSPGAEALYKLDTLKYLVGDTRARAMLVSYRDLPRWDLERARDLGIATCAGRELLSLDSQLRRWIQSAGRPF